MTKIKLPANSQFGFDIFWLLRLLAQLPPFEIELPVPGSDELLVITLDLEIKQ